VIGRAPGPEEANTVLVCGFLQNIGLPEGIALVFILLLLFGAKRLPDMMKSMGEGVREFKKALSGVTDSDKEDDSEKKESKDES
jgi:sec-independent protein translocase protein TatA